jgi:hypothetical protein
VTETAAIGVPVQQGLQPYYYILAKYLMTNRATWDPVNRLCVQTNMPRYAAQGGRGMGPGQPSPPRLS